MFCRAFRKPYLEVYNQLNQLQTSNTLKAIATGLQTVGPTQVTKEQPSYNTTITRTNNKWKCEKCQIPFTNRSVLKLTHIKSTYVRLVLLCRPSQFPITLAAYILIHYKSQILYLL